MKELTLCERATISGGYHIGGIAPIIAGLGFVFAGTYALSNSQCTWVKKEEDTAHGWECDGRTVPSLIMMGVGTVLTFIGVFSAARNIHTKLSSE